MKRRALLLVLPAILIMTGCAFHIPGPLFEDDYDFYLTVRLDIDPDDAEVFLDGRLIGEAYEFADSDSPIRLSSHNHTLTFRRSGYYETVVDLDEYRGRRIVLVQKLRALPASSVSRVIPPKTELPAAAAAAEAKAEAEAETETATGRFALILNVQPAEATIYIDNRFWGISPADGQIGRISFTEPEIRIDVLKPGCKPVHKTVKLTEQGEELKIVLETAQ